MNTEVVPVLEAFDYGHSISTIPFFALTLLHNCGQLSSENGKKKEKKSKWNIISLRPHLTGIPIGCSLSSL